MQSESRKILYVSPHAPVVRAEEVVRSIAPTAGGLRIGILDNGKGNADHLLGFLIEGLRGQMSLDAVVAQRKTAASRAALPHMLEAFAGKVDCVISAVAD